MSNSAGSSPLSAWTTSCGTLAAKCSRIDLRIDSRAAMFPRSLTVLLTQVRTGVGSVMFIIYVSHSEGCGKTIHEITRNGTKLFVLVRVFSWIVLYTVATVQVG